MAEGAAVSVTVGVEVGVKVGAGVSDGLGVLVEIGVGVGAVRKAQAVPPPKPTPRSTNAMGRRTRSQRRMGAIFARFGPLARRTFVLCPYVGSVRAASDCKDQPGVGQAHHGTGQAIRGPPGP